MQGHLQLAQVVDEGQQLPEARLWDGDQAQLALLKTLEFLHHL
jgi:hypothetical protein